MLMASIYTQTLRRHRMWRLGL